MVVKAADALQKYGLGETWQISIKPFMKVGAESEWYLLIRIRHGDSEELFTRGAPCGTTKKQWETFLSNLEGAVAETLANIPRILETELKLLSPQFQDSNDARKQERKQLLKAVSPKGLVARGGRRKLTWTDQKKREFLALYEAAKTQIDDAIEHCKRSDPLAKRRAILSALEKDKSDAEKLPANILDELAQRPDQVAATAAASDLALEVARIWMQIDQSSYLRKVITAARKLNTRSVR
jgi:hypothetical protein